ncbi:MAG: Asp-tRNA(Asn)/Glu-tRNA(Gln) amidotransferase subunit GatB, partial [Desulfatiglandales bacterium]
MDFEPVICFEIHAELKTDSKLFCACPNTPLAKPNRNICPICAGHPGVLPVLNKKAVELCIKAGLAFNCRINPTSKFARKNYFYPDLPKGYQISQYDSPLCEEGVLFVPYRDKELVSVGIKRVHLEEDAGKLVYTSKGIEEAEYGLVDLNRAGVPLIEIVSDHERDPITDLEVARSYLETVRQILRYIGASDCLMEMGQMRADVNVSLRPKGSKGFGNRVEIKNMSSFKFIIEAISYEISRQRELYFQGRQVVQETRLFDEGKKITIPMRSKEDAPDYRYFPEPDLVPLNIDETFVERLRGDLPELPYSKALRFVKTYGLSKEEALTITREKGVGEYFEDCLSYCSNPKRVFNWITKELFRLIPKEEISPKGVTFPPSHMGELLRLLEEGKITDSLG